MSNDKALTICTEHCGLEVRVERNERDISDNSRSINTIKTWVILGSASLILNLIMTIVKFIFS